MTLILFNAYFASHPAQGPIFDYINCLVQVSRILYSLDADQNSIQCLQFYNCAYKVHELHCAMFSKVHTSLYFHALLAHGPVQHEVVCCRSTNTGNEKRIFNKSAETAANCTDRKPKNMLPSVLKWLQCKRKSKTNNPIQSLKQANSRIALSAKKLLPFKGTVFKADSVKKRMHLYQAQQRIGHFLVQGEGVWWHKESDGSCHFHDGSDYAVFSDAGPQLLHSRNARLDDVLRRSNAC